MIGLNGWVLILFFGGASQQVPMTTQEACVKAEKVFAQHWWQHDDVVECLNVYTGEVL